MKAAAIATACALLVVSGNSFSASDGELKSTIRSLDQQLFDTFNKCQDPAQLDRHASFFSPEIEFYHDNGGVTWTRDAMIENTKNNACGHYTRELIEGTFSVSPVKDFGAISTGVHRFCQSNTNQCDGEADFAMVWKHSNGQWQVTRALSFGHRSAPAESANQNVLTNSRLNAIIKDSNIASASVAIIESGTFQYAVASGEARTKVQATPASLYNIASLTKPITAEIALRLVEEGKITLDENMSNFWVDPDIASDPRRNLLTPRLVMSHRTGFPNWREGRLKFDRAPGTLFGYSGEGYEYLARFILNKTKHPIDYWAENLVFSRIGMRNTTYTTRPWLKDQIALPHDGQGRELEPQIRNVPVASDDAYSTPSDYALFVTSLMQGQSTPSPLSKERIIVQTDRKSETCKSLPEALCPDEIGMALGWELYVIKGVRYFMHTGADDGTFTFAYFSPDSKSGAVIFTNSSNGAKAVLPLLRTTGKDRPFVELLGALAGE